MYTDKIKYVGVKSRVTSWLVAVLCFTVAIIDHNYFSGIVIGIVTFLFVLGTAVVGSIKGKTTCGAVNFSKAISSVFVVLVLMLSTLSVNNNAEVYAISRTDGSMRQLKISVDIYLPVFEKIVRPSEVRLYATWILKDNKLEWRVYDNSWSANISIQPPYEAAQISIFVEYDFTRVWQMYGSVDEFSDELKDDIQNGCLRAPFSSEALVDCLRKKRSIYAKHLQVWVTQTSTTSHYIQ